MAISVANIFERVKHALNRTIPLSGDACAQNRCTVLVAALGAGGAEDIVARRIRHQSILLTYVAGEGLIAQEEIE